MGIRKSEPIRGEGETLVILNGDIGFSLDNGHDPVTDERVVNLNAWDMCDDAAESIIICIPVKEARQVLDGLQAKIKTCLREQDLQNDAVALGIGEDYNEA